MNKGFKFISSLAMAGILATNSFAGIVSAVEMAGTPSTSPVGVYSKLGELKNVVPFILSSLNDRVTVKDLKDIGNFSSITKFNNSPIPSENTVVKTGDTFTADETNYTVIIYGDVESDGAINVNDVTKLARYINRDKQISLNDFEVEAADVENDGKVNVNDVVRIARYINRDKQITQLVTPLPTGEEVEDAKMFEINVNKDAILNVINENNKSNSNIEINLLDTAEPYNEDKTLTLKAKGADGKYIKAPSTSEWTQSVDISKSATTKSVIVNFSNFEDGEITLELLEGEIVRGTVTVTKNTVKPLTNDSNKINVTTNRVDTENATMSLEYVGEDELTKIYYKVSTSSLSTKAQLTESAIIENNKFVDKNVSNNLTAGTYRVYYMVENKYGNISAMQNAVIYPYGATTQKAVDTEKFELPTLLDADNTKFTWGLQDGVSDSGLNYTAILYRDGQMVAKQAGLQTKEVDFVTTTNYMNKPGMYKIGVIVEGNGSNTAPSEEKQSGEVEVKKLDAVTGLNFVITEDGTMKLAWEDNSNEATNVNKYTINLQEYKGEEEGYGEAKSASNEVESANGKIAKEVELVKTTDINPNTSYNATVQAIASDSQYKVLSSDETTLNNFYFLELPALSTIENQVKDITTDSVSIDMEAAGFNFSKIENAEPKYSVEAYEVNKVPGTGSETSTSESRSTTPISPAPTATLNDEGDLVIGGLSSNRKYQFKLKVTVGNKELESDFIGKGKNAHGYVTLAEMPEITNLNVVKTKEEAINGTIYYDGTELYVDGQKIDTTLTYASEFTAIKSLVQSLNANDVITINNDKIELNLQADKEESIDLKTLAEGRKVVLTGNENKKKTISMSSGITNGATELVLQGEGSIFTLNSNVKASKITVNSDVDVKGDRVYTLPANTKEAVINGVAVTTEKEVAINATGKVLNVTVNAGTNNNDMTFANLNDNRYTGTDATINFVGTVTNDSALSGKITITSNSGKVTVTQNNVDATGMDFDVTVTDTSVEIADEAFTGNKDIKVNVSADGKNNTVKAISKLSAIGAITNVELKNYTDDQIKELLSSEGGEGKIEYSGNVTTEVINQVREYINSFGINDIGAKVTVEEDELNTVKITFTKATDSEVTINGLANK